MWSAAGSWCKCCSMGNTGPVPIPFHCYLVSIYSNIIEAAVYFTVIVSVRRTSSCTPYISSRSSADELIKRTGDRWNPCIVNQGYAGDVLMPCKICCKNRMLVQDINQAVVISIAGSWGAAAAVDAFIHAIDRTMVKYESINHAPVFCGSKVAVYPAHFGWA